MHWVLWELRTGIMKKPQAWDGLREWIPEKKLIYWVLKDNWGVK